MDYHILITAAVVLVLGVLGWFATGQTSFLKIWLSWTAFCLVLFTALLASKSALSMPNVLAAWLAAPVVALLGWLRHYALASSDLRRRRGKLLR